MEDTAAQKTEQNESTEPVTVYHEQRIGKTLYRVTGVFSGQMELASALEALVIKKILQEKRDE